MRHDVVIDRLAWWYYHPREWLKKAALVNDTYLLNNPFTFQAMEKHSAYCAMIRLGFDIPDDRAGALQEPDRPREVGLHRARPTTCRSTWTRSPTGSAIPMFMKPFDGGAWRGVIRIDDNAALHKAYDESGQMLMHLQAAVEPYDCVRPLADHRPGNQDHEVPARNCRCTTGTRWPTTSCQPEAGMEILTLSRTINAFFRWEFNSCEVAGDRNQRCNPIDYANACPDIAITSLHYYFPWAITQLVSWSVFCAVTGRTPRVDNTTRDWFDVADDPDLPLSDKLGRYALMSDAVLRGGAVPGVLLDVAGLAAGVGLRLDHLGRTSTRC